MPKSQSSPFQKHHFIFSLACGTFFVSPAYAGKSGSFAAPICHFKDHPRVCGEKPMGRAGLFRATGSPPRMQGKGEYWMPKIGDQGITPAYAGKRLDVALAICLRRDHPRVCGEKGRRRLVDGRDLGSPPRMRGKVNNLQRWQTHTGITPAYAGKRSC